MIIRLIFISILAFTVLADDYQPRNTQKEGDHPPTPEEAVKQITVPDGFKVTLFAGEPHVRQPVGMALDDRGRLWVAESYSYKEWEKKGEDRILIFEDTDQDGRFDKRTVFWAEGHHGSGLAVGFGGVWVCDSPKLLFIPDANRDDVPDGKPEVILDGWTTRAGHNFYNGLKWGIDGWLYGRHGITAPSLIGPPGTPKSERTDLDACIWRWHPVRKKFEIVVNGTTNPWGLDWNDLGELFFTNNVNGHLWHVIPGARYPRMHGQGFQRHVYQRIGYCADHLHHPGSTRDWTKTRNNEGDNSAMGGGHSHCGGMIYLGDNWPDHYRDTIFMCNTHGRRVNNDLLERKGSGYVGRHGKDFLLANQPWFRGVELLYGPDGGVFIADWTDHGECHDNDGVHRESGRVYKVTWGTPKAIEPFDLQKLSAIELAKLQAHKNEYFVRHARRILHERSARGDDVLAALPVLRDYLRNGEPRMRLRAAWTLHVLEALTFQELRQMLNDNNEHVRAWAVRLSCDYEVPHPKVVSPFMLQMAVDDPSMLVRVYLASIIPRLKERDRWLMADALVNHNDDETLADQNLPLMIWYGLEPLVAGDPARGLEFFLVDGRAGVPLHRRFIARRITSEWNSQQPVIEKLVAYIADEKDAEALAGMHEALKGLRNLKPPAGWEKLAAIPEFEQALKPFERIFSEKQMTASDWIRNLDNGNLRSRAITELAAFDDPGIVRAVLRNYFRYSHGDRQRTMATLSSRAIFARKLLENMAKGGARDVPHQDLSAFHARQISSLGDPELNKQLEKVWGRVRSTSAEKKKLIAAYQAKLGKEVLARADHAKGKAVYDRLCAACHRLRGEGQALGPDLTGANRGDLYYLLENTIDPNAVLPDTYRVNAVKLKDGRTLNGSIAEETDLSLVVQTVNGESVVAKTDVVSRAVMDQSTMPEGMLLTLSDEEVRDLIGYLQQD